MPINGLPVKDATKKVAITITPLDIKKGDSKNPGMCAAAQACKRQLGVEDARVHIGNVYIKQGKQWTRFKTPRSLRGEIIAFDRGGKFMPGEYILTPHSPTSRLDARKKKPARWQSGAKKSNKRGKGNKRHTVLGIRMRGANR